MLCAAPPHEWVNPVTGKVLCGVTRETVEHYMGGDPEATLDTTQHLREECARLGQGWQTLEVSHSVISISI